MSCRFVFLSSYLDRNLLGIRTDAVQRIECVIVTFWRVEEIAIGCVILHRLYVGIGVRAITAAIHIATDAGLYTDSIAKIDLTSHIVSTIHVIDITTCYDDSGSEVIRERVATDGF